MSNVIILQDGNILINYNFKEIRTAQIISFVLFIIRKHLKKEKIFSDFRNVKDYVMYGCGTNYYIENFLDICCYKNNEIYFKNYEELIEYIFRCSHKYFYEEKLKRRLIKIFYKNGIDFRKMITDDKELLEKIIVG